METLIPLWTATSEGTDFPPLRGDLEVDVAVVGGGVCGLTAAALLASAGRSVALLEKGRVGEGESGRTTAHLTEVVDGRYGDLISDFGREAAGLVTESSRASIDQIEELVAAYRIPCSFRRLSGYLYTESEGEVSMLEAERDAMRAAGIVAGLTRDVPLPFRVAAGLRVDAQAELHPRQYLVALAKALDGAAVRIFEMTRVHDVQDSEPCRVRTDGGCVTARDVVVAAHVPINNRVLLHTKIAAYRSYAIAARLSGGSEPRDLFWDTADPYHYLRSHAVGRTHFLIVGGEDHKVGTEEDTERPFQRLETYLQARFGTAPVAYRWSGQIIESTDGLPFIGQNALSGHVYVATGFAGNGMTFGTLAGMILRDLILGRKNPWADVYAATRVKPLAAARDYVIENAGFPRHLVSDRLTDLDAQAASVEDVARGQGALVATGGQKYAVYRDADGEVHVLSPVCTHLGCDVHWNTAERTWDCPCHGSRFTPDGKVLNGLALHDLSPKSLPLRELSRAAGRRGERRGSSRKGGARKPAGGS